MTQGVFHLQKNSEILVRPDRLIDRQRHGTGDNKSVNVTQIFHREVSSGKTGVPFQEFRLFRKISSGTTRKLVFHLQSDRNFRNFLVNRNAPSLCQGFLPTIRHFENRQGEGPGDEVVVLLL